MEQKFFLKRGFSAGMTLARFCTMKTFSARTNQLSIFILGKKERSIT